MERVAEASEGNRRNPPARDRVAVSIAASPPAGLYRHAAGTSPRRHADRDPAGICGRPLVGVSLAQPDGFPVEGGLAVPTGDRRDRRTTASTRSNQPLGNSTCIPNGSLALPLHPSCASWMLAGFMVLTVLIQVVDIVDDLFRGALLLLPVVFVFAIVFLLAAGRLFGRAIWHVDAWRDGERQA